MRPPTAITLASLCWRPSLRGLQRPGERRPDAGRPVGGDLLAVARSTDHDAERAQLGRDDLTGGEAEGRVVVLGVELVGTVVDNLVPGRGEMAHQVLPRSYPAWSAAMWRRMAPSSSCEGPRCVRWRNDQRRHKDSRRGSTSTHSTPPPDRRTTCSRHVNGRWIDGREIPADRAMDGAFRASLRPGRRYVREIIQDAPRSSPIGDLYASFMDTERIAELGTTPLDEDFALIKTPRTPPRLTRALGALRRTGGTAGVRFWVDNDASGPRSTSSTCGSPGSACPTSVLPRGAVRRAAQEVRAARGPDAGLRPCPGDVGHRARTPRSACTTSKQLAGHHWDVVRDPRRDPHLQPDDAGRRSSTPRRASTGWPGPRRWACRPGRSTTSWCASRLHDREVAALVERAVAARLAALDDVPRGQRPGAVPHRRDRRGQLRLLRSHPQRAQEVRERWKRGVALVERAGRGRRRGVRRAALPAVEQGPDGPPRGGAGRPAGSRSKASTG